MTRTIPSQGDPVSFEKIHENKALAAILSKGRSKHIRWKLLLHLFRIILSETGSFTTSIRKLMQLRSFYRKIHGVPMISKFAWVDRKYYWRLIAPGFPSEAADWVLRHESRRLLGKSDTQGIRTIFLAITKKCALQCAHCFEWDNLNQAERLSRADLLHIVNQWQQYGAGQIMLSGGEPMLRYPEILEILKVKKETTDFWIITSGLGLTAQRAMELKERGLTGVMVSLDHVEKEAHDAFRGMRGSYEKALEAVAHAREAGLVTALSLCATREFVSTKNLDKYLLLAKKLNVCFVQFLDPRASGHYRGKEVALSEEQTTLLEKTMLSYNSDPAFQQYPIIDYPGYHQRRIGCMGSGNRFLYIDTDGDAHVCPFCTGKVCSSLAFPPAEVSGLLKQYACHIFQSEKTPGI